MPWYSEGEKTNPLDGAVLADTGSITEGNNVYAGAIISASILATVILQQRSAGGTTVVSQVIRVPANDTRVVPLGTIAIEPGGRMRVLASGVTVGLVQASIVY